MNKNFLDLTERCSRIEGEIRASGLQVLQVEFFPELSAMTGPLPPPNSKQVATTLYFLLQIIQVMEDTWLACELDIHWNHPLNQGWMNYFSRWASTASLRMWWPVLKPIYGPKFRQFAEDHFGLAPGDAEPADLKLRCSAYDGDWLEGLAWRIWRRTKPRYHTANKTLFSCDLVLRNEAEPSALLVSVQVALAFVEIRQSTARWHHDDFFVPPGLWGSGIGGRVLGRLCEGLKNRGVVEFVVELAADRPGDNSKQVRSDEGARRELTDLIAFYKSAGFTLRKGGMEMERLA